MESINRKSNNSIVPIVLCILLAILIGVLGFIYASRLAKMELALENLEGQIHTYKVGVLDIQRVIEESPKAVEFQIRLDEIGEEIDQEFHTKSSDLNEEAKQVFQQQAYGVYLMAKQQLEIELDDEIEKALEIIIQAQGLDLVIYKQGMRMGGIDITDQVIAELQ